MRHVHHKHKRCQTLSNRNVITDFKKIFNSINILLDTLYKDAANLYKRIPCMCSRLKSCCPQSLQSQMMMGENPPLEVTGHMRFPPVNDETPGQSNSNCNRRQKYFSLLSRLNSQYRHAFCSNQISYFPCDCLTTCAPNMNALLHFKILGMHSSILICSNAYIK